MTGFDQTWLSKSKYSSWLYKTELGMFCRICRQHKQGVVRGSQTRVFIESPCQSYRKDKLDVHMASEHHKIACQRQSGLTSVVLEHEAVVGAFKCLYWLIKHEIAHHTNYPALLELANLLGCTYFDKLHIGQETNYRSHRIIDEMLEILATVVEQPPY
ncbi:UDP-glucose 4-epimerase [Dissostichus eleginoides]|uniref:UDP-glucose 4-epimerase n=1 Tax=Dissostichus eleginoides TaxID=100907 RepID=A0AAD9B702_DISEL|nr:UDP-glucose 4-epimerase [Dissostichus eleginoides]